MKYDKAFFDQSFDRYNTACIKWDAMEAQYGEGINPMWVADMDFVCPEELTEAMVKRAAHPVLDHRLTLENAARIKKNAAYEIIDDILGMVTVPTEAVFEER